MAVSIYCYEVQIGFPQRGPNAGILHWNPNCLWVYELL